MEIEIGGVTFVNHRLRAKRWALEISNAKSADERKPLYRDLLATTEEILVRIPT